jgi:hypothetical protein
VADSEPVFSKFIASSLTLARFVRANCIILTLLDTEPHDILKCNITFIQINKYYILKQYLQISFNDGDTVYPL